MNNNSSSKRLVHGRGEPAYQRILVTIPLTVKYSFKKFLQMKVVVFCLGLYTITLKALKCQCSI